MSIPLCHTYVEDKFVWPFTSSGTYTVKSGYHFLAKEDPNNLAPVNLTHDGGIWKLVWGLSIPNKVKNFLWRSCRDAILVKKNLKKCKILLDDSCDHCNITSESVLHAFWECPEISMAWDCSIISIPSNTKRLNYQQPYSLCSQGRKESELVGDDIVDSLVS